MFKKLLLGLTLFNSAANTKAETASRSDVCKFLAVTGALIIVLAIRKGAADKLALPDIIKPLSGETVTSAEQRRAYFHALGRAFIAFCNYGLSRGGALWRAICNKR